MTQSEFDAKWIAAIRGRNDDRHRHEWEAGAAIKELRGASNSAVAYQPNAFRAQIFAEIEKYERLRAWVPKANKAFRNAISDLEQIGKRLLGTEKVFERLFQSEAIRPILGGLLQAANSIRNRKHELEREVEQFWKKALATNPFGSDLTVAAEDASPEGIWGVIHFSAFADEETPDASTPMGYIKLPEASGDRDSEKQNPFPEIRQIEKRLDLDRHFQLRVAHILHSTFPALSKATLARLVVLTYICSDLVEYDAEGRLHIRGNKRTFTPDAVYQKIKGYSSLDRRDL